MKAYKILTVGTSNVESGFTDYTLRAISIENQDQTEGAEQPKIKSFCISQQGRADKKISLFIEFYFLTEKQEEEIKNNVAALINQSREGAKNNNNAFFKTSEISSFKTMEIVSEAPNNVLDSFISLPQMRNNPDFTWEKETFKKTEGLKVAALRLTIDKIELLKSCLQYLHTLDPLSKKCLEEIKTQCGCFYVFFEDLDRVPEKASVFEKKTLVEIRSNCLLQ